MHDLDILSRTIQRDFLKEQMKLLASPTGKSLFKVKGELNTSYICFRTGFEEDKNFQVLNFVISGRYHRTVYYLGSAAFRKAIQAHDLHTSVDVFPSPQKEFVDSILLQLIATASVKGTLIRIYDMDNGTLLQEVRRGANAAEIFSLAFSSTARVPENEKSQGSSSSDANIAPSSSSRSFIKFKVLLPKYFNSERSVARFHLHEGTQYTVAFGLQKKTVIILGMDGRYDLRK
ncbi:hypothetical protein P8452_47009 [Trifolium repens]|nr:hypothetical protein P8452_47009 [Trifolium repens]